MVVGGGGWWWSSMVSYIALTYLRYMLGFTFVVLGQGFRILAMVTAAKNFSRILL